MVGKDLQRDVEEDRLELGLGARPPDRRVGQPVGDVRACQRDDRAAARLDLLDRGNVLGQQLVPEEVTIAMRAAMDSAADVAEAAEPAAV